MIVLDDARVLDLVDQGGIVTALKRAFIEPAQTPSRMHCALPGDDEAKLLIMPSWSGRSAIGVKIVTVIPSNRERGRPTIDGAYILMDGKSGQPLAILNGPVLTGLRTAGVCALAASVLSRTDTKTLLMIGTGALAPYLVRAYMAVRNLERVIIWGRDSQKGRDLADTLSALPVEFEVAHDLSSALHRADLVCSATLTRSPLVAGARIAPGAHVDLVGSFTPEMREADTELFRRGRLVVDTMTAFDESGDIIEPLRERVISRSVPDLAQLLREPTLGRASAEEITIFKSVGTGIADLGVARYVLDRYEAKTLTDGTRG